jgi:hypothetical protein
MLAASILYPPEATVVFDVFTDTARHVARCDY